MKLANRGWLALACACTLGAAEATEGEDWPHWRGPLYNGSSPASETDGGYPTDWSPSENVRWKTELPGPSAATPIVSGDYVFLTAFETDSETVYAIALNRTDGKLRWKRRCGRGQLPSPRSRGRENTLAAPSPVTDGEVVCFLFGNGLLSGFDYAGDELWRIELVEDGEKFSIGWGYAASPLLFGGRLYVPVLQRGASYLLAVDPKTGETLWKHMRENSARAESQEAYTTPIPFENHFEGKSRSEILVLGADCLTSHDPETGAEYWRWCGLNPQDRGNFRTVSSPVVGEDGMIFVTSPQHNPMHGLRVVGDEVEKVWEFQRPTPDSTTPLYYGGRLYAVDGRNQRLVCLDPATGVAHWIAELETPSFLRASPTGVDGKIYVMDAEGTVVVIAAEESVDGYRELGRIPMESYPSRSTPVPHGGELLLRTAEHLFCIGGASAEQSSEVR